MKITSFVVLSLSGVLTFAACVGAPDDDTDATGEVGIAVDSEAQPADISGVPTDETSDKIDIDTNAPFVAPHCWACGNTKACYDSHSINTCFVTCYNSGAQMWDLGEPPYGTCDGYAWNFCTYNNLGHVTMRCWGGYY